MAKRCTACFVGEPHDHRADGTPEAWTQPGAAIRNAITEIDNAWFASLADHVDEAAKDDADARVSNALDNAKKIAIQIDELLAEVAP